SQNPHRPPGLTFKPPAPSQLFPACCFFFSSRRRHTRWPRDWSSDVCSSDLARTITAPSFMRRLLTRARHTARRLTPRARTPAGQIGRASCRERVEIAEVGGGFNKKEGRYTGESLSVRLMDHKK